MSDLLNLAKKGKTKVVKIRKEKHKKVKVVIRKKKAELRQLVFEHGMVISTNKGMGVQIFSKGDKFIAKIINDGIIVVSSTIEWQTPEKAANHLLEAMHLKSLYELGISFKEKVNESS